MNDSLTLGTANIQHATIQSMDLHGLLQCAISYTKNSTAASALVTDSIELEPSSSITIGNHTFQAALLGQLLQLLLDQHPELSI